MADIKFSELTAASTFSGAEILAMSQTDLGSGSLISRRSTLIAIANYIAIAAQYSNALNTTDKTITGAINELKQLISLIPQFSIEVVQTLPTEGISDTTIYLVPSSNPETQNAYDEYIHVNNAWEFVGSTAVDLSAYYTKLEVDGLLATKANTADVSTALALKENTADMEDDVTDIVVDLTDTQETAEGNPVTLQTVQEGYAKAVTIKLTPKQDLHGYDKPWPGGGGKNKFDEIYPNISTNLSYLVLTVGDGQFTLSSTCPLNDTSANLFLRDSQGAVNTNTHGVWDGQSRTVTAINGNIYIYYRNTGGVDPSNYHTQLEAGATATAYEPYANICPIEGYEEASATRTGKNSLDTEHLTFINGHSLDADGNVIDNASLGYVGAEIPVTDEAYTISGTLVSASGYARIFYFDSKKSFLGRSNTFQNAGFTFTPPNGCALIGFQYNVNDLQKNTLQLELGETATEYEPYDGATATAEFAETIYGATGDAAGGDWEKQIKKVNAGLLAWVYDTSATPYFYAPITGKKPGNNILCSIYKLDTRAVSEMDNCTIKGHANNTTVIVKDNRYTNAADFKTAMSGVEISYELATPEPFQTAPAPLALRKGDNTITTDGDSVKVKYNKLALPDIGGLAGYISALEARVAALEGGNNRSLSLVKAAMPGTKEEQTTEETDETEDVKNENDNESK